MNRTVLVLMMAVTVEALVEYAKTFGNGRLSRAATRSCFRAPLQSCPIPFSRIRWRARRIPST